VARLGFVRFAALLAAPIVAVASCSSKPAPNAQADSTVWRSPSCPPEDNPNRCAGDDSTFVYFPALVCDSSAASDGGAAEAAAAADLSGGDAGIDSGDLCAGVTTLSVFFSPQACLSFVEVEANRDIAFTNDPSAPVIDEPSDGDMLSPDEWSIFVWHDGPAAARRDPIDRAFELLEPSAYAAPPLNGEAYVLEFSQGCTEILRVMLTGTAWAADPASWGILTSLSGPVRLRVVRMRFAADALVSTPVASRPISITMKASIDGG